MRFFSSRTARRNSAARSACVRPRLEVLEARLAPASFPATDGFESIASDGLGELQGKVPVYLIFAGNSSTGFGYNGSVSAAQITSAVQTMLGSGYLAGLAQYEPPNSASMHAYLAGTCFNTSCFNGFASPPSLFNIFDTESFNGNGDRLDQLSIENVTANSLSITLTVTFHDLISPYYVEQSIGPLTFTVPPNKTIALAGLSFLNDTIDTETAKVNSAVLLPTTPNTPPTPLYYPLPTNFTSKDINNLVAASAGENGGPLDNPSLGQIYMVVTPPGYRLKNTGDGTLTPGGLHDEGNTGNLISGVDPCQYTVATSVQLEGRNPLDSLTLSLSNELVDTITDPYSTSFLNIHSIQGVEVSPGSSFPLPPPPFGGTPTGELTAFQAQNYAAYANGVWVQSYWSQGDQAYVVPGATLPTPGIAKFINLANESNVSVAGNGIDGATISVTISDDTNATTAATTTVSNGVWSVSGINASALADGTVTYTVTATDGYNNTTTINLGATKDTVVPNPQSIVVTDSADISQQNVGGDEPTDINGLVSLRSAIAAANYDAGLGASDTITIAPALEGTALALTQGQLELTADSGNANGTVTIIGNSSRDTTVGGSLGRVFKIDAGANAVFENLTISGGVVTGATVFAQGGGILSPGAPTLAQGGGIFNAGLLTLINDAVDNNQALGIGGPYGSGIAGANAEGGGIFNALTGVLRLQNTVVEDSATGGAGVRGLDGDTPAAGQPGTDGSAGGAGGDAMGGCIYNDAGSVTIDHSVIDDGGYGNTRGGAGGNGGSGGDINSVGAIDDYTDGGNGGNGGAGGAGLGGAIYNNAGIVNIINHSYVDGSVAGGAGGLGGYGGVGDVPFGGNGGNAGNAAAGGLGAGGVIYNAGTGSIAIQDSTIANSQSSARGGTGGRGGVGGAAGHDLDAPGASFNGGNGGRAGPGGAADGGAIYNDSGAVTITNTDAVNSSGLGVDGGTGGAGGVGGGGNGGGQGGNGADGSAAGASLGGFLYNQSGSVTLSRVTISNTTAGDPGQYSDVGGQGGAAGNGGYGNPPKSDGGNPGQPGSGAAGTEADGGDIYSAGGRISVSYSTLRGYVYGGNGGGGGAGAVGGWGATIGRPGSPGGRGGQGGGAAGGAIAIFAGAFDLTNSTVISAAVAGKGGMGGVGGEDGPYGFLNGGVAFAGQGYPGGTGGNGGDAFGGTIDLVNGNLSITNSTLSNTTDPYLGLATATGGTGGVGGTGAGAGYFAGYSGPPGNGGQGGNGGNGFGGAINVSGGTATVIATTISANHSKGGPAGPGGSPGSSIAGQTLPGSPGVAGTGQGGGIAVLGGNARVVNTIIAGNTASTTSADVFGAFTSQGYNLIGDGTGSTGFTAIGDQVGSASNPINPLLAKIQPYGNTMALLPGSPAIDAGGPLATLASPLGPTDRTLTIANGTVMPAIPGSYAIQFNDEQMLIRYLSGNTFAILQRGYGGTFATGHQANANIFLATDELGEACIFNGQTDIGAYGALPVTTTTATSVTSDIPAGSTYGQEVTFTAEVSSTGGTPTGSIQFAIDGSDYGPPVELTNGIASIADSGLSAGAHNIVAFYTSDNSSAFIDSDNRASPWMQTITPAALTITANNQTMVYGGTLPTLTPSYTGFVNGDSAASITTAPGLSTTATATSPVGSYGISAAGALDLNYTISYVAGTLSMTPAALTITANNQIMVYGGTLPTLTASYTGFVNGDTAASLTIAPSLSTTATATSPVGSYGMSAAGAVDPNYTISYVAGTLSITPAALTITANNQVMVYGGTLPTLTASYTGVVNGDSAASLTTAPSLSSTATATSPVGSYGISATGAVDSNYTISYVAGTLTVIPAPAKLLIKTAPPGSITAGTAFGLVVGAVDTHGNVVPTFDGTVTLTLANNPGGSSLAGRVQVSAVNGIATFTGLTLNKVGRGYRLMASCSSHTIAARTAAMKVTPAAAAGLMIASQPLSVTAGAGFSIVVKAKDAYGNVATSFSGYVTLALSSNPGGSTIGGRLSLKAANGMATFSRLTLNKAAHGYTLLASGGTLSPAATAGISVTPAAATRLVVSNEPPTSVTVGAAFGLAVAAEDAFGNVATSFGGNVTMSLVANPISGSLGGIVTVKAVNGVATYTGLTLNKAGAGYTLKANSGLLVTATAGPLDVTPE
jgi:hypothetical protein